MINQKLQTRMPEIIEILHDIFNVRCETCVSFEKYNDGAYYGKCRNCGQTMALCHYCDRYEQKIQENIQENIQERETDGGKDE